MDEREKRLEQMIHAYQTELTRVAVYLLKDRMLAEAAVQETFLKVYRSLDLCPAPENEKAWIYRIALNTVRDMLRRIRIRRRYAVSPFPLPASSYDNTLTDIIALHTEIARLPRKLKEVILLYYYQDFP